MGGWKDQEVIKMGHVLQSRGRELFAGDGLTGDPHHSWDPRRISCSTGSNTRAPWQSLTRTPTPHIHPWLCRGMSTSLLHGSIKVLIKPKGQQRHKPFCFRPGVTPCRPQPQPAGRPPFRDARGPLSPPATPQPDGRGGRLAGSL